MACTESCMQTHPECACNRQPPSLPMWSSKTRQTEYSDASVVCDMGPSIPGIRQVHWNMAETWTWLRGSARPGLVLAKNEIARSRSESIVWVLIEQHVCHSRFVSTRAVNGASANVQRGRVLRARWWKLRQAEMCRCMCFSSVSLISNRRELGRASCREQFTGRGEAKLGIRAAVPGED